MSAENRLRIPELYNEGSDLAAREQGLVYVEDISVSGLIVALRANADPVTNKIPDAFLSFDPREPLNDAQLHQNLKSYITKGDERAGNSDPDVAIRYRHALYEDKRFQIDIDLLRGYPVRSTFIVFIEKTSEYLTGFEPFDPTWYDHVQGFGAAQRIVSHLRTTDNPETKVPESFEGPSDLNPTDAIYPELCPDPICRGDQAYPVDWEQREGTKWCMTMRCPNCEEFWPKDIDEDDIERLDARLDRGTDSMVRDLRLLTASNMEVETAAIIDAINSGLILPEDF